MFTSHRFMSHLLASSIAFTLAIAGAAHAEPIKWQLSGGGNGNYYDVIVGDPVTWDEALALAASIEFHGHQGRLVTVNSQAENDFIADTFGDLIRGAWIGGFQVPGSIEPAGGWEWITGEPFAYTNWAPREPNNSGGFENNLVFATAGGFNPGIWNDMTNTEVQQNYVVEIAVPEVPSITMILIGFASIVCATRMRTFARNR